LVSLLTENLYNNDRFQELRERRRRRIGIRCARTQTAVIATVVHNLPNSGVTDENHYPVPILQRYLIALIGAFAGRELTVESVEEYLHTVNPFDTKLENLVEYAESLIRGNGSIESAIPAIDALARSRMPRMRNSPIDKRVTESQGRLTYMIGRSAEQYFFNDSNVSPQSFASDAQAQLTGIYLDASGTHQVANSYFDP
jgi:hypothetical protein